MAYERRSFAGAAAATTLNGSITDSATSLTLTSSSGWPSTSGGSFIAVIDEGTASEEVVLVGSRSGTACSSITRGYQSTTAAAHANGAAIRHVAGYTDFDEANYWVAELSGAATAAGKVVVADGSNSLTGVAAGTSGQILVGNGTTIASVAVSGDATLASNGALTIATGAVTSAKILDGTIATGDIADDAVTAAKIADGAIDDAAKLATGVVTSAKILDGTIAAGDIASDAITTAKILDSNVTYAKLAAAVQALLLPPGVIVPYGASTAPTGWLLCYGQAVNRTTYADLFAIVGTTYGTGDGSTTFNVPDLRGRTAIGADNLGGSDAGVLSSSNTLGTAVGAETVAGDPHTHTLSSAGYAKVRISTSSELVVTREEAVSAWTATAQFDATGASGTSNSGSNSSATELGGATDETTPDATSVMQPSLTLAYIIKT